MNKTVIAIHGGAGSTIKDLSPADLEARRQVLTTSVHNAQTILTQGGTAIEAVTAAILVMENSPLFNAGKGAVFTHEGHNEMDACIMDGYTHKAGAVGGVRIIKNPILAAKLVLTHSKHDFLISDGAEKFARDNGLEIVDPSYFYTDFRYQQLQKALAQDRVCLDHEDPAPAPANKKQPPYMGTVGAVALDQQGNLAAATSTGGMTNKKFGRIGDSPIPGAGNYANNESIAVSCTGTGDIFLQVVAGHELHALYKYQGLPLQKAAAAMLQEVYDLGGHGGLVAIDKDGNFCFDMNTPGMYRGLAINDGPITIKCFKDE